MKLIVTVHVATAPVPPRVHVPEGVNATVPVGVDAVPVSVSVIVAVQVVTSLITIVEGMHATVVVVECNTTAVTGKLTVLVLVRWFVSPL